MWVTQTDKLQKARHIPEEGVKESILQTQGVYRAGLGKDTEYLDKMGKAGQGWRWGTRC